MNTKKLKDLMPYMERDAVAMAKRGKCPNCRSKLWQWGRPVRSWEYCPVSLTDALDSQFRCLGCKTVSEWWRWWPHQELELFLKPKFGLAPAPKVDAWGALNRSPEWSEIPRSPSYTGCPNCKSSSGFCSKEWNRGVSSVRELLDLPCYCSGCQYEGRLEEWGPELMRKIVANSGLPGTMEVLPSPFGPQYRARLDEAKLGEGVESQKPMGTRDPDVYLREQQDKLWKEMMS